MKIVPCFETNIAGPAAGVIRLRLARGFKEGVVKRISWSAAWRPGPAHAVAADADVEAIKAVVKAAYVDGVHAKPNAAAMRAGFHPAFRMLVLKDGAITGVTLDEWAARIEKGAAERTGPAPEIRHEFASVDVTGERGRRPSRAASRRQAHVHRLPVALPLPRGWKIVSKTFQAIASRTGANPQSATSVCTALAAQSRSARPPGSRRKIAAPVAYRIEPSLARS